MKLVFMGTPQFAVPHLKVLAARYDIAAVVTRPDRPAGRGRRITPPPVKEVALELGLSVVQPQKLNDPDFREYIQGLQPDLICVVAYGGFLPRWLLELPPKECVNVHPSLLPKYRGAAPIQRSLMNGDTETGVTTMYLVEEMDAGDIILQERTPIGPDDDAGTLHDRLASIGSELLCKTVDLIAKGTAPRRPQDHDKATLAPKIEPEDELIAWDAPARSIDAKVRGLRPRPGAYTWFRGRRVKVWRLEWSDEAPHQPAEPGTVLEASQDGILVATGSGTVRLLEVQPENSKRLTAQEFMNGYRIGAGDRFAEGDA